MNEFGLTGGIGAGKSSVARRLVALGAGLVDADATVRALQRRGQPVFEAIVGHFGDGVVGENGELDRPALADIVFNDADELKALNNIVHPAVRTEMNEQRKRLALTHEIIVLDVPLLIESGYQDLAGIVVVDVPVELAIERLVQLRGYDEADARARIASQLGRDERLKEADFVIDNSGSLEELDAEVDRCWHWMHDRRQPH